MGVKEHWQFETSIYSFAFPIAIQYQKSREGWSQLRITVLFFTWRYTKEQVTQHG